MRTSLLASAGAALLGWASVSIAATPVSPPVVEYRIEARLDEKSHTLEGRERVVWRNPSDDEVGVLLFHLYLNAISNAARRQWTSAANPAARLPGRSRPFTTGSREAG